VRRAGIALAAVALTVLAGTAALFPLEAPWFTRALSERYSLSQEAGLSAARMTAIAEQVRAFVVDGTGQLPGTVDGRPGFDAAAVAHLGDVRSVLRSSRLAAGIVSALVFLWVVVGVFRRDTRGLASALRGGFWATIALVIAGVVVAASDFSTFFSAFHSLFFASGTWLFPEDSLLIRTFPEKFWVWGGVGWGLATLTMAISYRVLAGLLSRSDRGGRDDRHAA
jgi:integral membrane protein (TIGR01906 family)